MTTASRARGRRVGHGRRARQGQARAGQGRRQDEHQCRAQQQEPRRAGSTDDARQGTGRCGAVPRLEGQGPVAQPGTVHAQPPRPHRLADPRAERHRTAFRQLKAQDVQAAPRVGSGRHIERNAIRRGRCGYDDGRREDDFVWPRGAGRRGAKVHGESGRRSRGASHQDSHARQRAGRRDERLLDGGRTVQRKGIGGNEIQRRRQRRDKGAKGACAGRQQRHGRGAGDHGGEVAAREHRSELTMTRSRGRSAAASVAGGPIPEWRATVR